MPSKRELVGNPSRSSGLNWSEIQWGRIGAFLIGVSFYIVIPSIFNSDQVSPPITAVTSVIPIILLYYSFTQISWQKTLRVGVGMAMVSLAGMYLLY
ncbi:MAG: hypothetical protein J07HQW2_03611 [Haloquadratum walsbyi J07HQW2]|uniref:EamA domain-containing protein n=1 Tax=Haloquadratum walsbyi J07HQW2 TaxID=1238425 RepID=U1NIS2_9EURY|nr:MAG: hypothetical protein J07HQW2_03611 [Haloquadratum walsbyi J07HQW2]